MQRSILIGLMMLATVVGCAGMSPAQVGQTAGTIAGAAVVPGVGAPVGAVVGLLAGLLVQGEMDKGTEKRERKELSQELTTDVPASAEPASVQGEPARVWVDETLRDGRLIPGHFDVRFLP